MKQEVQPDNEDGRIKEQAVLDLGTLLAKHGRAAGDLCFCSVHVIDQYCQKLEGIRVIIFQGIKAGYF